MIIIKFKNLVNQFLKIISYYLLKFKIFRFIFFSIKEEVDYFVITNKKTGLKFYVNNYLLKYRVDTFLEKEPQTINWINSFQKNKIFYDIGSNIGLYSCYAAKNQNSEVYSFEPSVYNLEILAKNIEINSLEENITIIPFSLSNKNQVSEFYLTSKERGGALSSFGEKTGHDGKYIEPKFFYKTVGMSLKDAVATFKLPYPNYIKIDVDGIEHLILEGANSIILKASSILIEINHNFDLQKSMCEKILLEKGFVLHNTEKVDLFNVSRNFENSYNQLWLRK